MWKTTGLYNISVYWKRNQILCLKRYTFCLCFIVMDGILAVSYQIKGFHSEFNMPFILTAMRQSSFGSTCWSRSTRLCFTFCSSSHHVGNAENHDRWGVKGSECRNPWPDKKRNQFKCKFSHDFPMVEPPKKSWDILTPCLEHYELLGLWMKRRILKLNPLICIC